MGSALRLGTVSACALVLGLGGASVRSERADPRGQVSVSPMDLATYYSLGEFEMVESAVRQAAAGQLDIVVDAFRQDALTWIDADGPAFASQRRLVVAAVALETAYAGLDTQWVHSKEITQWACRLLRAYPAEPAERDWHLTALAIIEGARDWDLLGDHIDHLRQRFPDEPRLLLAEAFGRERWLLDEISENPINHRIGRTDMYDEALAHPATAPEAHLRLGFLLLQAQAYDEAITHLRRDGRPDDPAQRYLARLFEGWALERREPPDAVAARVAFGEALDALPNAYSASLALALNVYRSGSGADVSDILHGFANADPPVIDPWLTYGYGDLRRWPQLIAALRGNIQ